MYLLGFEQIQIKLNKRLSICKGKIENFEIDCLIEKQEKLF